MKRYETIVIVDPEVSDENRGTLYERYQGIISQGNGLMVDLDTWGTRTLAYEIKKKGRGFYFRLDYCGIGSMVDEIERFSRIDDRILKYMTVMTDPEVNLEQVQADIAAKKEAEEARQQEKAALEESGAPAAEARAQTEATEVVETAEQPADTPSEE